MFRRLRKTDSDVADVTCCGRLFQTRAAATEKARSPFANSYLYIDSPGDAFSVSRCCKFVLLGQISEKSNRPRFETILHIVLKVSSSSLKFDSAIVSREEKGAQTVMLVTT